MNFFFLTLIIFVIVYLFLSWFAKTSSRKISKGIRMLTIALSAILAIIMVYAGRFLFSLPFLAMILPLIKTKAGLSLFQLFRIWSLLRILNLDPKKKYTKDEIINSYKKIMKKIHPDVSPELTRLASIVNEAKEVILKNLD